MLHWLHCGAHCLQLWHLGSRQFQTYQPLAFSPAWAPGPDRAQLLTLSLAWRVGKWGVHNSLLSCPAWGRGGRGEEACQGGRGSVLFAHGPVAHHRDGILRTAGHPASYHPGKCRARPGPCYSYLNIYESYGYSKIIMSYKNKILI